MEPHLTPYVIWALGLAVGALSGVILWVKWSAHQAFASKGDTSSLERRLSRLESTVEAMPTAGELADFNVKIVRLEGKIDTLTAIMSRVETVVMRHEDMIAEAARVKA